MKSASRSLTVADAIADAPGDCRLFPDRPGQEADITCATPALPADPRVGRMHAMNRICACNKPPPTAGAGGGGHRRQLRSGQLLNSAGSAAISAVSATAAQPRPAEETATRAAPPPPPPPPPPPSLRRAQMFGNLDDHDSCPWETFNERAAEMNTACVKDPLSYDSYHSAPLFRGFLMTHP